MIEFMVMEKKADGEWEGLGRQSFRIAPRIGEYIDLNDEEGIGQTYEVIAVMHPMQPASTAGDLIIRHLGTGTDFRKNL